MSVAAEHAEWLSLLEYSGPFLTMPVLLQRLPDGLDVFPTQLVAALRQAVEQRDNGALDTQAFVLRVLRELLGYDEDILERGEACQNVRHPLPEWGEELQADAVLLPPQRVSFDLDAPVIDGESQSAPVLLVMLFPQGASLERALPDKRCPWTPARRMEELCRAAKVPLGLVSNGEQFMLVYARQNRETTYASWYATYWLEERITLRSFVTLLHKRRFFAVAEDETLPRLMEQSASAQQEVTEKLGMQVRSAMVEFLGALDRLDRNTGQKLLGNIPAARLYEAALVVMMRLVFLLSAEERGMLRLGEPAYDEAYAVSTLCEGLRELADRHGEEVLAYRTDAWCRLLALFRAVYGGVTHERLRLMAHGGSLFDPDAYPVLEGRQEGTCWRDTPANPLPVDDRVVLHMLESLQFLRDKRTTGLEGAVRLSFRGLDVEQIGHVYEGLLDRTALRAPEVLLGLRGGNKLREPFIPLADAEQWLAQGEDVFVQRLVALTGATARSVQTALQPASVETGERPGERSGERGGNGRRGRRGGQTAAARQEAQRAAQQAAAQFRHALLLACGGDEGLQARIAPFASLLRVDAFGRPLVVLAGGLYVTAGSQRRDTGTHYTPRSLTALLVQATLEPHVFSGPERGLPREQWQRRPADALLELKICDMAMGSGAFLVQACRYLAEQLAEAWNVERTPGIPADAGERLALARRQIADSCLYGVDNNPLAVEMAKLSLWLITLQKDRPFTFLDHALRCGDALMGVTDMRQLEEFTLDPQVTDELVFGSTDMRESVRSAQQAREQLESLRSDSVLNVERKAALLARAERDIAKQRQRADALIMAYVEGQGALGSERRYEQVDKLLSPRFAEHPEELEQWLEERRRGIVNGNGKAGREQVQPSPGYTRPLHWALEFPEVFGRENPGFDAFVGNPPFKGSQIMRADLGNAYREYLVVVLGNDVRGKSDLAAYFFLRAAQLVRRGGDFGLVATNTIAQGDTREVGLLQLEQQGLGIRAAWPDMPWEGNATVCTSQVVLRRPAEDAEWAGAVILDGQQVSAISTFLKAGAEAWEAKPLVANKGIGFQGSIVLGEGFLTTEAQARQWIAEDEGNAAVLFPYLNGEDLTSSPTQQPSRWVINFWDWPENTCRGYKELFQYVETNALPDRLAGRTQDTSHRWWQFARPRPALYHALGRGDAFVKHPRGWEPFPPLERVLVMSLVSKYGIVAFVPNTYIMSHALGVFASSDAALFGLLQSNIHHVWARKMCSTMRTDMRYTPSSTFDTFPRPLGTLDDLRDCAGALHAERAAMMQREQMGLTDLYNALHNPEATLQGLKELRAQHAELDKLVAAAYGWNDLDMAHDFRQVDYLPSNDNIRHTIAEPVRLEVLQRLLTLNRERSEVKTMELTPSPRQSRTRANGPQQGTLL